MPTAEARNSIRSKYGWEKRLVLAFSGDAVRYYDALENIIRFAQAALEYDPKVYLLLLVYGDLIGIRKRVCELGLDENNCSVMTATPDQMPKFLSAADVGLSFKIKTFANAIASPIKFAEYLSCGLPVIINPGVGDTSRIIQQYQVGVVVDPINSLELERSVKTILNMIQNDPNLHCRCRQAAECELSSGIRGSTILSSLRNGCSPTRKRAQTLIMKFFYSWARLPDDSSILQTIEQAAERLAPKLQYLTSWN